MTTSECCYKYIKQQQQQRMKGLVEHYRYHVMVYTIAAPWNKMNTRIAPITISELPENYFEGTSNDEEITRSVRLVSRFQDFSKAMFG